MSSMAGDLRSSFSHLEGMADPTPYSYSHGIRDGELVFVAGQCGTDAEGAVVSHDLAPQAERAIDRVETVLRAAGATLADVVTMTVFFTDLSYGREFHAIRATRFPQPFPASAMIGVSTLMPKGALIEIQVTAVRRGTRHEE